jgi:adenosylmethionine-8-amino-7-oxononanoate aminotransferase
MQEKTDLAALDHAHVWHPFTQMKDWLKQEPIVIVKGKRAILEDAQGRKYLDANSSIWTNLHGHNHPKINAAIKRQLRKVAHSSALGLANEPASFLAQRLCLAAQLPEGSATQPPQPELKKVFYSDDGSTAMEVALKLAYEFARRTGRSDKPRFLSLEGAYHGDTIGAVSLGHIDLFHKSYAGLLFPTDKVMAPYCYRCPYNRAKPERADARDYRQCNWECVSEVERKFSEQKKSGNPYAAIIVEPLIQGAAGMIPQPAGWLKRVAEIARVRNAQIIADEVMTGFGRTGIPRELNLTPPIFACHHENAQPDFMVLAKGLTGGYLPMAATLTSQAVFDAFLGDYAEFKTFFHGHSYTANQLGSAAALANLDELHSSASIISRRNLQDALGHALKLLWKSPFVGDIRQVGLVAGIELVKDWRTRETFDLRDRAGARVCEAMARRGVLTRPIGNVIVVMPPYCTTARQVARIASTLAKSIAEVFGRGPPSVTAS